MTINSLLNSIESCHKNIIYIKNKIYKEINNYNNLFINLSLENLNLEQQKLIKDIVLEIYNQIKNGKFKLKFDLQYTNPARYSTNPGSPLNFLSDDGHKWFNNLGFETKNIIDCWQKSSSCNFGCNGDGICYILIDWSNKKNILNRDFNASICYELSNIVNKYNNLQFISFLEKDNQ